MPTFMKWLCKSLAAIALVAPLAPASVQAQECFIGEVRMFAGNFAPRGWALAQGQIMAIAQNTALFSILGTTYGGNGQTTFALPDLRGRFPMGTGQGPGLSPRDLGEVGGTENTTLSSTQMPAHSHSLQVTTTGATSSTPSNSKVLAGIQGAGAYSTAVPNTSLSPVTVGPAGGSQPFSLVNPFLGINFIICMEGIYPSRP